MKTRYNVPILKKNNSGSLVIWVHSFGKQYIGPFAILSIKLTHNIFKAKIILNNKNTIKKSDFQ